MSTVLIIGDTHAPCMRKGYIGFLKRTADEWQPDRIVHIGDLVDNCAYSYHDKNPKLKNPEREYKNALQQVRRLTDAFPEADLLIGNHDALIERVPTTAGLDSAVLKPFGDFWNLPKGWTVHDRYSDLIIEGVQYMHGDKYGGGIHAAFNNAKSQFRSVVQGHLHANLGVQFTANNTSRVFGMCVGCGVDHRKLAMEYGVVYKRKPILGCGIVRDGVEAYAIPWNLGSKN